MLDNSTNEINNSDVENDVCENKVGESTFWADSKELAFVLGIHLQSKTHCTKIISTLGIFSAVFV
jgi:hypothetical protein